MRQSAQRPLPALFAILLLIGTMVVAAILLKNGAAEDHRKVDLPVSESAEQPAE